MLKICIAKLFKWKSHIVKRENIQARVAKVQNEIKNYEEELMLEGDIEQL